MARRFRKSTVRGKVPIKHGSSLIANTGPGAGSLFIHNIFKTDVGERLSQGAPQVIKKEAQTDEVCEVGDQIKYVNLCIECGPRGADSTNIKDDSGWLEWGVIWQREEDADLGVANIGIESLGVLLGRMYRENAVYSGCFPIGSRQAMSVDIKLKIPKRMCALKMGDKLKLFCYTRSTSSTDTRTDSFRILASSMFKAYS